MEGADEAEFSRYLQYARENMEGNVSVLAEGTDLAKGERMIFFCQRVCFLR